MSFHCKDITEKYLKSCLFSSLWPAHGHMATSGATEAEKGCLFQPDTIFAFHTNKTPDFALTDFYLK